MRPIVVLVFVPAAGFAASQTGPTANPPPLAEQRAFFARKPRHLYGCGIIPGHWIGKDASYDAQCMDRIKAMGGTSTGVSLAWPDVERERSKWTFDIADQHVKLARERGLELLAYMGSTPDWALPPEAKGKPRINHRYPPADEYRDVFVEYCRRVARRYRGKIRYYQFWNEPNGCSWIRENCRNADGYALYTRWLKIWYVAVKTEDPDCVLAAGGLDYHEGVAKGYEYLEGMYREGAKGFFDAFAIHPYDKRGKTPLHYRAIRDTRRVMVEHGDWDKDLWVTEYGLATDDEKHKADWIRAALRGLNSPEFFYVTHASYLSLTDPPGERGYGLCENDLTPRASYEAFRLFPKR